ncbi:MAG: GNAT family N-acetyltransferase [Acidimicrobiales bacterium]
MRLRRRPPVDRLPTLAATPFVLRGFRDDDLAAVREAAADPVVLRVSSVPSPYDDRAGREYLRAQQRRLHDGFGYSFAIADQDDDRAVGSLGVWLRDLDRGRASVGYWVVPSARRRGAASAALASAARWALTDLGVERLELYVEPWNEPSIRTATRAGFVAEGLLRRWEVVAGERRDMWMFSLVREDLG